MPHRRHAVLSLDLEERAGVEVLGPGFPTEMIDKEPEEKGYEVVIQNRKDS